MTMPEAVWNMWYEKGFALIHADTFRLIPLPDNNYLLSDDQKRTTRTCFGACYEICQFTLFRRYNPICSLLTAS